MPPEFWSITLGAALAIVSGVVTQWVMLVLQTRQERRSLAHALGGEIGAIVSVCKRRKYLEGIQSLLEHVKQTNEPQGFPLSITHNYFTVFESNTAKIGLLPPRLSSGVARFYIFAKSLIEDVKEGGFKPSSVEGSLALLSEGHSMLSEMLQSGETLAAALEAL